jgi:predicted AlkP superfamily pyrophosphatase or phosphodiesterase
LAALIACLGAEPIAAAEAPKLVLLVVVDQLRADRIGAELPGGLGRLVREGRVFAEASLGHAPTETCPGHATMVSGRHPGAIGVPANYFVDRETGKVRSCVGDAAEDARTLEGAGGRSPRGLRGTTLGDWLKQAHARAHVFAVSAKDRAAIVLGGKQPDGVYWLEASESPRFTTSRYYASRAPAWLRRFNGDVAASEGLLSRVPERWKHAPATLNDGVRQDDYRFEDPVFGRTSGHPLRSRAPDGKLGLLFTPFVDELTLDLARLLIHEKRLGRDATPDFFALSLSATDWIGHRYGPESHEARDALRRLDAALGDFLAWLEGVTGPGGLLVVSTSDHGVLPIPEWLAETGRSRCPAEARRVDVRALAETLAQRLAARFGAPASGDGPWLQAAGFQLTANRSLANARSVDVGEVLDEAQGFLESQPGVAHVWTRDEMEAGRGPEPFATLYRNSFDPERSGDLVVQPAPDCLLALYATGTDHGSPHLYDRAVPLIFWGAGVEPGRVQGRAQPVDIAPTVADQLGIATPEGLDGRALTLRPAPEAEAPP